MTNCTPLSLSRVYRFRSITVFGISETGPVRPSNEDNFLIDEHLCLVMLGDGMGGHYGGEIASTEALNAVRDFMDLHHAELNRTDPIAGSEAGQLPLPESDRHDPDSTWPNTAMPAVKIVHQAVDHANNAVFQRNRSIGLSDGSGMGTTLTGFWNGPDDGSMVVFHVGDSRLYRYRAGGLVQLTRDQTAYQEAIEHGATANLPPQHLLLQAVGPSPSTRPDVWACSLEAGDLLMLCSDGLHGSVPDGEIKSVLATIRGDNLEQGCARLVTLAKESGGRDNITVVLAWCAGVS